MDESIMQNTRIGQKLWASSRWLPSWVWQQLFSRWQLHGGPLHVIIAIADHFEPSMTHEWRLADMGEQQDRLARWCREYPKAVADYRDSDCKPLQHTYFFPAEQYHPQLIARLVDHCREGFGEIEIHLHHGIHQPDTAQNTRRVILQCRDALATQGCLATWDGQGEPRYAFVHGNWALANSARGLFCGVDDEMQILAETGCYADFTLPSAPHPTQISKINSLYECALPLNVRAPHKRGHALRYAHSPRVYPLIIQGPLMLDFSRRKIENGEISAANPPTLARFQLWKRAAIAVKGRHDWIFVKLHCHGLDPREQAAMSGPPISRFLDELLADSAAIGYKVHFVSAREMVNIILAACDGRDGDPGVYRDYRLRRFAF
jgi:hypothetical protein